MNKLRSQTLSYVGISIIPGGSWRLNSEHCVSLHKQKNNSVAIYTLPLATFTLLEKIEYMDVKLTGETDVVRA